MEINVLKQDRGHTRGITNLPLLFPFVHGFRGGVKNVAGTTEAVLNHASYCSTRAQKAQYADT